MAKVQLQFTRMKNRSDNNMFEIKLRDLDKKPGERHIICGYLTPEDFALAITGMAVELLDTADTSKS